MTVPYAIGTIRSPWPDLICNDYIYIWAKKTKHIHIQPFLTYDVGLLDAWVEVPGSKKVKKPLHSEINCTCK